MQPISQPKSLMEETADRLRIAIVTGELALGAKLSEQRLANTLQVSRSPVRDALAILQSEGLVTVSPKRGTFVFTPDMRVVSELCEHRSLLETAALRLGLERNQAALLDQMDAAIDLMQKALEANNPAGYTAGDQRFHRSIVESSENRSFIRSYELTIGPLKALRTHLFTIMAESTDRSMVEHKKLMAACRRHDPDLASKLLWDHIMHLAEAFKIKEAA